MSNTSRGSGGGVEICNILIAGWRTNSLEPCRWNVGASPQLRAPKYSIQPRRYSDLQGDRTNFRTFLSSSPGNPASG
eukprot:1065576-Amorphochlora_amoeboformis.AAC.2